MSPFPSFRLTEQDLRNLEAATVETETVFSHDVAKPLYPRMASALFNGQPGARKVEEPAEHRGKFTPCLAGIVLLNGGKPVICSRIKAERLAKMYKVRCRRFLRAAAKVVC